MMHRRVLLAVLSFAVCLVALSWPSAVTGRRHHAHRLHSHDQPLRVGDDPVPPIAPTPIFDGTPLHVTNITGRMSWYTIRLQSAFLTADVEMPSAAGAAIAAPSIPPLVLAWSNTTASWDDKWDWSAPVATLYVAFTEGVNPDGNNYNAKSTSGALALDPMLFLGISYVVVGVDLGPGFEHGAPGASFSILAQLFQPVDVSACLPQLFPFPPQTKTALPAQFAVPVGTPPQGQQDKWVASLLVSVPTPLQTLSPFVSTTLPATATSAMWNGYINEPLLIQASDANYPPPPKNNGPTLLYAGIGVGTAATQQQTQVAIMANVTNFVLITQGSSYCPKQQ